VNRAFNPHSQKRGGGTVKGLKIVYCCKKKNPKQNVPRMLFGSQKRTKREPNAQECVCMCVGY